MDYIFLIHNYISWHYGRALRDFNRVWENILWFTVHFFSFKTLIRTLFAPWRRLNEPYSKNIILYPQEFLSSFVVNMMMRIVGFMVRVVAILMGLFVYTFILVGGGLAFFLWFALPAVVVLTFLGGVFLIFVA